MNNNEWRIRETKLMPTASTICRVGEEGTEHLRLKNVEAYEESVKSSGSL